MQDKTSHPRSVSHGPFCAETAIVEAELRIDWNALKAYYRSAGIKCLNCPAAEFEDFAQGARLHGFDLDAHLAALNGLAREHPFTAPPLSLMGRLRAVLGRLLQDRPRDT